MILTDKQIDIIRHELKEIIVDYDGVYGGKLHSDDLFETIDYCKEEIKRLEAVEEMQNKVIEQLRVKLGGD